MTTYTKTPPVALKPNQDRGPEPVSYALLSNLLFEAHAVSAGRTNPAYVLFQALRRHGRREEVTHKTGTRATYTKRVRYQFSKEERKLLDRLLPEAFSGEVLAAALVERTYENLMRSELEPQAGAVFTEAMQSAIDVPFELAASREIESHRFAVNTKLAKAGLGPCECDRTFRCRNCVALDRQGHQAKELLLWLIDHFARHQGVRRDDLLRSRRARRDVLNILLTVYAGVLGLSQVDVARITGWSEETVSKSLGDVRKTWPDLGRKDLLATTSPRAGTGSASSAGPDSSPGSASLPRKTTRRALEENQIGDPEHELAA